jgi:hypothetical protein
MTMIWTGMDSRSDGRFSTKPEIVCACAAGDVLVMRPLILHASNRALHPARRRVLHFEYAPRDALDPSLYWAEPTVA